MKEQGWISIYRSIRDHWIWQDPVKFQWWIDILLTVNHEDSKVNIGMQIIDCKRGQSVMSLLNWGKRWGVSKHAVHNFFTLLKNDNMITTENLTKSTRITVCNYDTYQEVLHATGTLRKRKGNATGTLGDTNNNDNNDNKGIESKSKRFIPPTIEDVHNYCLERKNKVDPEKFVDFYKSKDWMIGSNKMKDWRAAIRTWEKSPRTKVITQSTALAPKDEAQRKDILNRLKL